MRGQGGVSISEFDCRGSTVEAMHFGQGQPAVYRDDMERILLGGLPPVPPPATFLGPI